MSPRPLQAGRHALGFPRVSGDEPKAPKGTHTVTLFSPRERG